jgi:alkylation response protein AidB-like acyl-CoA dehydrogenase
MHTLGVERGVSTLAQQIGFANDFDAVVAAAKASGAARDPDIRRRIADAWIGLQVMRLTALRTLGATGRASLGNKLYWSTWHQKLGELAMDVLGPEGDVVAPGGEPTALQRLYLFTRADTIYAGSSEIQRNIIGERGLGLPPEPRP